MISNCVNIIEDASDSTLTKRSENSKIFTPFEK